MYLLCDEFTLCCVVKLGTFTLLDGFYGRNTSTVIYEWELVSVFMVEIQVFMCGEFKVLCPLCGWLCIDLSNVWLILFAHRGRSKSVTAYF